MDLPEESVSRPVCPIPKSDYTRVMMAHGGGGKMTGQLIDRMFRSLLGNRYLDQDHDGAVFDAPGATLAFSTDSFVVHPSFFPGGNIGDLAVNGTVNDLACCGAVPRFLSLAFILEEGLPLDQLWEVVQSIHGAAGKAGTEIVTGDTKVVERGKCDQLYINTSGIGEMIEGIRIAPNRCTPGDVVIINGSIAEHGIAVMSVREGLSFETPVMSDTASLAGMIRGVLESVPSVHVLRDPTRGGLSSALNEISKASSTGITLFEDRIPVTEGVRGACEILGFDPLYVANEGKVLVIVPEKDAGKVLQKLRSFPEGRDAAVIGEVTGKDPGIVRLRTTLGSHRIVDMISGEQLPRIC